MYLALDTRQFSFEKLGGESECGEHRKWFLRSWLAAAAFGEKVLSILAKILNEKLVHWQSPFLSHRCIFQPAYASLFMFFPSQG